MVVARIDAKLGEQFHLRPRDVAIAVRILFQIILMVFLGGVVVFQRPDLHEEFLAAPPLNLRDALYGLPRPVVGIVDAGLVLASDVIPLPVLHRGVDDVEIRQQQRVKAHLFGVVLHPHGFTESRAALADGPIVRVRLAGAVGIAALGVDDAGNRLHQLFHAPEAAARQIYDMFRVIHIHALLTGRI